QGVFTEWLLQKDNRPSSQAPAPRLFIVVGRDEDDGNRGTSGVQPLLQFEPAHSRHPDIGNQTIRLQNIGRIQKLLTRPNTAALTPTESMRLFSAWRTGSSSVAHKSHKQTK